MNNTKKQKIMFSGGGTGGSVTPLLAVATKYRKINSAAELLFVGTKNGPERTMVEQWPGEMRFISLISGKWRRYFSLKNILDLFKIEIAFYQSLSILLKEKPSVVVSAGSFVSVPLVWAAWLLNIPVLIHQQDIRPGLANRLMSMMAKVITVTFEKSLGDYGKKSIWTGNPVNELEKKDKEEIRKRYNLVGDRPVTLVIGGGTGAVGLNELVFTGINDLLRSSQIVHLTGENKQGSIDKQDYQSFSFLPHREVINLMIIADVVISRCGFGVLTELAFLKKPAILIPMPNSHQEDNARLFQECKAALVLNQTELTGKSLALYLSKVLGDKELLVKLENNIFKLNKAGASEKIVELINGLIK